MCTSHHTVMHDVHGLIFALSHLGASVLRVLFWPARRPSPAAGRPPVSAALTSQGGARRGAGRQPVLRPLRGGPALHAEVRQLFPPGGPNAVRHRGAHPPRRHLRRGAPLPGHGQAAHLLADVTQASVSLGRQPRGGWAGLEPNLPPPPGYTKASKLTPPLEGHVLVAGPPGSYAGGLGMAFPARKAGNFFLEKRSSDSPLFFVGSPGGMVPLVNIPPGQGRHM